MYLSKSSCESASRITSFCSSAGSDTLSKMHSGVKSRPQSLLRSDACGGRTRARGGCDSAGERGWHRMREKGVCPMRPSLKIVDSDALDVSCRGKREVSIVSTSCKPVKIWARFDEEAEQPRWCLWMDTSPASSRTPCTLRQECLV